MARNHPEVYAMPEADQPSVEVRIKDMKEISNEVFLIKGVQRRDIDIESLKICVGSDDDLLIEKIMRTINRHDICEILADRISY